MSGSSMAILNLSPVEIVIVLVVAIVVFGRRLPEVAGQAAGAVQRMRRSLDQLRRETGIDREIQNARRAVEDAVPRDLRDTDLRRKAREGLDGALRAAEVEPEDTAPIPPAKRDVARAEEASGSSETPERPPAAAPRAPDAPAGGE